MRTTRKSKFPAVATATLTARSTAWIDHGGSTGGSPVNMAKQSHRFSHPRPRRGTGAGPGARLGSFLIAGSGGQMRMVESANAPGFDDILRIGLVGAGMILLVTILTWAAVRVGRGVGKWRQISANRLEIEKAVLINARVRQQQEAEQAGRTALDEAYASALEVRALFIDKLPAFVAKLRHTVLPTNISEVLQNGNALLDRVLWIAPDVSEHEADRKRLTRALLVFGKLGEEFTRVDAALALALNPDADILPGKSDIDQLHRRINRAVQTVMDLRLRHGKSQPRLADRLAPGLVAAQQARILPCWIGDKHEDHGWSGLKCLGSDKDSTNDFMLHLYTNDRIIHIDSYLDARKKGAALEGTTESVLLRTITEVEAELNRELVLEGREPRQRVVVIGGDFVRQTFRNGEPTEVKLQELNFSAQDGFLPVNGAEPVIPSPEINDFLLDLDEAKRPAAWIRLPSQAGNEAAPASLPAVPVDRETTPVGGQAVPPADRPGS